MEKKHSINITPTWSGIYPYLVLLITSGTTEHARTVAKEEMKKMAKAADLFVETVHAEPGNNEALAGQIITDLEEKHEDYNVVNSCSSELLLMAKMADKYNNFIDAQNDDK